MAFPDVVALLIGYVESLPAPVAGLPIVGDVPPTRPDRFVQVRRIGGGSLPPVRDNPTIDIRAWAPTPPEATEIGSAVRTGLWLLPGTGLLGPTVYTITEVKGLDQMNDPETFTPMAWLTVSFTVRADDVIQFS